MDKKKIISLIVFIIGLVALTSGVIFLIINFNQEPGLADGEYLVSAGEWFLDEGADCEEENESAEELNCLPSVIWDFTEIGKGTLTTNNHINDYDFIWALENGKLLIETKWLYDLENEYEYKLNRETGELKLVSEDKEYLFKSH